MNVTEKVLALDLGNLSPADLDWLHTLKNKAQKIAIAMYLKEEGIETLKGDLCQQ